MMRGEHGRFPEAAERITFTPERGEQGKRADAVLASRAQVSRTLAQEALSSGEVTVSGAAVRPSHRLRAGDVVAGVVSVPQAEPPQAEQIPLQVRYSDERVLVVSKPAGLVTHPAGGHSSGTLVNALLALGVPLAAPESQRPGIVHRLDKDTSGLLLVAKDDEARRWLVDAMKAHRVQRHYLALVRGRPMGSGTVEAPIGRHPVKRSLMAVVPDGRRAITHYRVRATTPDASLLDVRLETGRTHQVRVHLAHIRHPVLGDRTYGGASELSKSLGLQRPFLHAWRLAWPPPGEPGMVEVVDELPHDLVAALDRAGLTPPSAEEPSTRLPG